jgi:hypothetical protein
MLKRPVRWPILLEAVVIVPVAAVGARAASDRAKTTQPPALTAADYVESQQLAVRYSYALAGGADLARCEPHGPQFVRHFLTNVVIDPAADGAIGRQYVAVIDVGDNSKPSAFFLLSKYEDVYIKTLQGWRFKSRDIGGGGRAAQPGRN